MKDILRLLFIPIVGIVAMGLILMLIVWGGHWYDEVVNEKGKVPATSKDLGGYAVLTFTGDCDDSYYPVCGFDGVTYDNACKALAAGTKAAYRGGCR